MSSGPPAKGPRRAVRIGKYEVVAHIASGGMAAVYRARDTESGREVALKVLSPEMAAKPAMLERFRREARDSGAADVRSDLYSLGCTWYHLLAGRAPFPQGSLAERLYKIMNEEPPDVRKFNPRVSAATAGVLERLLAKDPAQRYQTPAEL